MDFKDLTTTKEFQKLHPLKKQIIEELVKNSQTTPLEMMLPKVVHINKELAKRNMRFTKEESQLLIQILQANMTDEERKKVNMLMNFMS